MAMFTKRRPLGEAGTAKSGGFGRTLGIILGVALIAILVMSCFTRVPTGNTGIVTTFGKVENYTLDAGMHFKLPWQKIVKMDNRVQKQSIDLMCFSSDIQEVSMTYTINYQISKADAMTIYSAIGINYYETVVIPCITESVKTVTARYTAEELVGMRSELASAIEADLSAKLIKYNIELVSTSVENMDFTDVFTEAVEAKQVAAQNKLTAQTRAEQEVIEAEAAARVQVIQAQADADAMLAKAQAEAEATRIRAEAEAEANAKVAASLTEALIKYTYAQAWDGKYPTYYGGSSSTMPVIDMR